MAATNDRRLDELIDLYEDAAIQLSDLLSEMTIEKGGENRRAIYLLIATLLANLRSSTEDWLETTAREIFEEGDEQAVELLESLGLDDLGFPDIDTEIDNIVNEYGGTLFDALASVQNLSQQVRRGDISSDLLSLSSRNALVAGTLGVAGIVALKSSLAARFRESAVSVLGTNGRIYRFSLDYYAGIVSNRMKYDALSRASILRTLSAGQDLVQVSPNASTIGDYCDLYKGKVFSISGMHPMYPPLSSIPNGGCPMHVNCHHSLLPYVGEGDTGFLPDEFLALAEQGTNPNDFQAAFEDFEGED